MKFKLNITDEIKQSLAEFDNHRLDLSEDSELKQLITDHLFLQEDLITQLLSWVSARKIDLKNHIQSKIRLSNALHDIQSNTHCKVFLRNLSTRGEVSFLLSTSSNAHFPIKIVADVSPNNLWNLIDAINEKADETGIKAYPDGLHGSIELWGEWFERFIQIKDFRHSRNGTLEVVGTKEKFPEVQESVILSSSSIQSIEFKEFSINYAVCMRRILKVIDQCAGMNLKRDLEESLIDILYDRRKRNRLSMFQSLLNEPLIIRHLEILEELLKRLPVNDPAHPSIHDFLICIKQQKHHHQEAMQSVMQSMQNRHALKSDSLRVRCLNSLTTKETLELTREARPVGPLYRGASLMTSRGAIF